MNDLNNASAISVGLSTAEVTRLKAEGKVNRTTIRAGKSYGRIILDNLFTFFNMVWVVVATVLIIIGSYSNLTFLATLTSVTTY